jgi:hypothetical protein
MKPTRYPTFRKKFRPKIRLHAREALAQLKEKYAVPDAIPDADAVLLLSALTEDQPVTLCSGSEPSPQAVSSIPGKAALFPSQRMKPGRRPYTSRRAVWTAKRVLRAAGSLKSELKDGFLPASSFPIAGNDAGAILSKLRNSSAQKQLGFNESLPVRNSFCWR